MRHSLPGMLRFGELAVKLVQNLTAERPDSNISLHEAAKRFRLTLFHAEFVVGVPVCSRRFLCGHSG
jgi:hypothetical protein